jgi:tetratricopeptide (TPR) repeat protein
MKKFKFTVALVLPLTLLAGTVSAQILPITKDYWSSKEFVDKFAGSYGIDTKSEPQISQVESELFQQLVEMLQTDLDLAITTLRDAITPESSPALTYTLANLYMEKGDFVAARAAYEKAIKAFPGFRRAYKNLGVTLIRQEEFKAAIEPLTKAIEMGENGGDTYGLLAYCYLTEEKYQASLEGYRMATLLEPDNREWRIGKVQALMETQQYEEAIAMLGELLLAYPERQAFWISRANAYLEIDKPMDAASQLEILRRIGNPSTASLVLLGDIYMNADLPGLALTAYKEALDASDEVNAKLSLRVAKTLASRGAFEEATEYIRLLDAVFSRTSPDDATKLDLLNVRAEVAMGLDKMDEAADLLEAIIEEDPLNARALRLLANYHYTIQELEEAEFYLDRLSKIPGFRAEALVQLARMKVAETELREAVAYLEEAQMLEPNANVQKYLEAVRKAAESY